MKKVLFATDGSKASEAAQDKAVEHLRVWPESTLTILYVTDRDAMVSGPSGEARTKVIQNRIETFYHGIANSK
ncbi:universal stress protein [Fodinisporobacter ferrooxydans]|uniref:Universal stress protein n=1 Tax=Fodinisporobacter ferrooxydans TaxID=2901836 RepID=A0ABY4CP64_9BACL|nr:universal stress protein [Alicyclobacillaceae bacterium MYW30-H2]